ncbi:MAG: hypothetical protein LUD47_05865 [Clostridia bacterium]|nr:hypothetical protein [Clostridia bacterium]
MKKQIIIVSVTALTTICLALCVVGCGGDKNVNSRSVNPGYQVGDELGYDITYFNKLAPEDADPLDGSGNTDNVSYMAYVMGTQSEWTAVSDNYATALINKQQTWTDIYYRDGYMLANEKSYSSFVKTSHQAAFVCGRDSTEGQARHAYLRDGSKPSNDKSSFSDVTWKSDVTSLTEEEYYLMYGLFPDEISLYAVNDYTVIEAGDVVDNGDGTYSQHFELDNEYSVYYYKYSMMTHSGTSSAPTFSKVEITFTFDGNFRLLMVETYDEAKVSGFKNTTTATTTYCYPDMEGYKDTVLDEASATEAAECFGVYLG